MARDRGPFRTGERVLVPHTDKYYEAKVCGRMLPVCPQYWSVSIIFTTIVCTADLEVREAQRRSLVLPYTLQRESSTCSSWMNGSFLPPVEQIQNIKSCSSQMHM